MEDIFTCALCKGYYTGTLEAAVFMFEEHLCVKASASCTHCGARWSIDTETATQAETDLPA